VRLVHIAVAKQRFFRFLHFWTISLPTGLFCKKWQFLCFTQKIILRTGHFSTLFFHFGISPPQQKIAKTIFAKKRVFRKKRISPFSAHHDFFVKNHKSKFFMYFSKSSSNVAALEIQNLKKSLDFSKMQKIATKNSHLFLVRSAGFFQKQRFL
jgi:hypothetical protein